LGEHFIGMYLDGSLASGGFDQDSDVDFVVVTDVDISGEFFPALQAMHDRIARLDTWCAIQLEGSYIPLVALRRHDPAHALYPNIERGEGERLKMAQHGEAWIIHRYILREHGIPLAGPAPQTLIDPVLPDDLRRAVQTIVQGWGKPMLADPHALQHRGYQAYVVLSLCRILYTLQHGAVVSKLVAARWTQEAHAPWAPLIERAWEGRQNSSMKASLEDVNGTLDFIRYTLACSQQFGNPSEPECLK
jgi:hypothetical protein